MGTAPARPESRGSSFFPRGSASHRHAGRKVPQDVISAGPEEVCVVSGTFNDGDHDHDHPAGTFLHAAAGSWHVPQSATGCRLFVFSPEG
ncbi:hypothetical protein ACH4CC_16075 [Streptomyces lydicus]|uniref:hypothetical protein n=1 Tax=Streptomyces lydicus TaxID=47763 RepID=UPI0037AEEF45